MSKISNDSNISRQGYYGAHVMGFRRREAAYFRPNTGDKRDNLKESQKVKEIKVDNHMEKTTTQSLDTVDIKGAQITIGDQMKDTEMNAQIRK